MTRCSGSLKMMSSDSTNRFLLQMVAFALVVAVLTPAAGAQESPSDAPIADDDTLIDRNLLPQVEEGRLKLPPLQAATISTDEIGNGRVPEGFRGEGQPTLQLLPERAGDRVAGWNWTVCHWAAANTFSNPRYFEDRMLERHGHRRLGFLQPGVSGARFFATIPMLPYLMAVRDPCDCEYTLGYYRPGNRVPAFLQRPPYVRNAMLTEAAVIAGAIIAFP